MMGNQNFSKEWNDINSAITTREAKIPKERNAHVYEIFQKGIQLIGTKYNLGGTLGIGNARGIDCSHFAAYCIGLSNWEKENTWSLDDKYKDTEVPMDDAEPGDLLMWPWHYDVDLKREIGHVEIVIGRTEDGKIVTLGASGLSRVGNKYTLDGKLLEKHNCVGFSVRNQEKGMRILRA